MSDLIVMYQTALLADRVQRGGLTPSYVKDSCVEVIRLFNQGEHYIPSEDDDMSAYAVVKIV